MNKFGKLVFDVKNKMYYLIYFVQVVVNNEIVLTQF